MMERIGSAAYWVCLLVGVFLAAAGGYAEALSVHPHPDKAAIFGAFALTLSWVAGRLILYVLAGR